MTLERFIAVALPLQANRLCTVKRAKLATMSLFLIVFAINFHFLITHSLVKRADKGCQSTSETYDLFINKIWPWIDASIYSFIPLTLLIVFNVLIVFNLLKASKKMSKLNSSSIEAANLKQKANRSSSTASNETRLAVDNLRNVNRASAYLLAPPNRQGSTLELNDGENNAPNGMRARSSRLASIILFPICCLKEKLFKSSQTSLNINGDTVKIESTDSSKNKKKYQAYVFKKAEPDTDKNLSVPMLPNLNQKNQANRANEGIVDCKSSSKTLPFAPNLLVHRLSTSGAEMAGIAVGDELKAQQRAKTRNLSASTSQLSSTLAVQNTATAAAVAAANAAAAAAAAAASSSSSSSSSANRRLTIMLLVVSITFCITSMPIVTLQTIELAELVDRSPKLITIKGIFLVLQYINHSINFFLYAVTGKSFRREFFSLFDSCRKKKIKSKNNLSLSKLNGPYNYSVLTSRNTSSLTPQNNHLLITSRRKSSGLEPPQSTPIKENASARRGSYANNKQALS
jgi:hypothetical protein